MALVSMIVMAVQLAQQARQNEQFHQLARDQQRQTNKTLQDLDAKFGRHVDREREGRYGPGPHGGSFGCCCYGEPPAKSDDSDPDRYSSEMKIDADIDADIEITFTTRQEGGGEAGKSGAGDDLGPELDRLMGPFGPDWSGSKVA